LDPRFKSAGFSKDDHASNAIILLKEQLKNLQELPPVNDSAKTIALPSSVQIDKQKNNLISIRSLRNTLEKKLGHATIHKV